MSDINVTMVSSPIEREINNEHEQFSDKLLVGAFNTYRKKLLKLAVDAEVLEAHMRNAQEHVEGRRGIYIDGEGWAQMEEADQPSLFQAQ